MNNYLCTASIIVFSFFALPLQAATPEEAIVDAFNTNQGGQKPGVRSSNAKGQCVKGDFVPTEAAQALTKSVSFSKPVAVLGRFSVGTGNIKVPDTTKMAIRGFSFKLAPDTPNVSEFAFINTPIFFAKNLEQLLGFVQARTPGADGKPDTARIAAFAQANPDTTRQAQWLSNNPVPASFAEVDFWGIHAYKAIAPNGKISIIKFKLAAVSVGSGLSDEEVKTRPTDFLVAELSERLAKDKVSFKLVAILGQPDDKTDDPTSLWLDEHSRKTIDLGTIRISAFEDNKVCDAVTFNPVLLAAGLEGAKDDQLFKPRSLTYSLSLSRRTK
jgi:catalase